MSPEVERAIRWLAQYWVNHPEAGDSATGIAEFWLRDLSLTPAQVQEALNEMIQLGWINSTAGPNGQSVYKTTPTQVEVMKRFLNAQ